MRLLGAVGLAAHRERALDRGGDGAGQQEPRQVAGADALQRLARAGDEGDPRGFTEPVDRVAVEIDDLAQRELLHGAEASGGRAVAYDVTMEDARPSAKRD